MPGLQKIIFLALALSLVTLGGCVSKKALVKGEPDLDRALEKDPEAALKLFREGSALLLVDNQAALAKFSQAIERDKTLVPAYFNAGVAEEALGHKREAAQYYESCLAIEKLASSCLENLLFIKHQLNEDAAAISLADAYLREHPDEPFVHVARAKLAFVQGELAEAEQHARAAIERDAESIEALYVMARIFYERKSYAAAKWVAKNALELAPSHGGFYLLMGHINTALDLLHEALDSYALAVKYYPSEEALESYALMLLRRGRVVESLSPLQRLTQQWPQEYRHHLHLGNAYMANKKFAEARASYMRAQELNPADRDVSFNLGLLFLDFQPENMSEIDRYKTAQGYFQSYLEQEGLSAERITEVNGYLKNLEQKIQMAESAKHVVPEEPEPHEEPVEQVD